MVLKASVLPIDSQKRAVKDLLRRTLVIHTICWLIFIAYELTMIYLTLGKLERPYIYIIYYPINIAFFYLYVYLLDKAVGFKKNRLSRAIIGYLILIATYLAVKGAADYLLTDQHSSILHSSIFIDNPIRRNVFRGLYFTVLASFYWSAEHISFFRKQTLLAEKQQLTIQRDKAELEVQLVRLRNAYLQQQINPHMLFNALNFVYGQVQQHSEDAAHCIWLMAEIMRFSMESNHADGKVELSAETEQIKYLIEINAYRYPVEVSLNLIGDFSGFRIIPLILLTLVENVFKHGDLSDAEQSALLRVEVDASGRLLFHSHNVKKSKNDKYTRPKLGLQNLRLRLEAAYPGNYNIRIAETEDFFELTLTINL